MKLPLMGISTTSAMSVGAPLLISKVESAGCNRPRLRNDTRYSGQCTTGLVVYLWTPANASARDCRRGICDRNHSVVDGARSHSPAVNSAATDYASPTTARGSPSIGISRGQASVGHRSSREPVKGRRYSTVRSPNAFEQSCSGYYAENELVCAPRRGVGGRRAQSDRNHGEGKSLYPRGFRSGNRRGDRPLGQTAHQGARGAAMTRIILVRHGRVDWLARPSGFAGTPSCR